MIAGGGVVCDFGVRIVKRLIAFAFDSRDRTIKNVPGLSVRFVAGAVEGAVVDSRAKLSESVSRSLGAQSGSFSG